MKRRAFLGATTVLLAGCSALPVIPRRPLPAADAAGAWIRHDAGRYTLLLPRAEMGQQIDTALVQIAAEELGIEPAQLTLQRPSTLQIGAVRATVGSESLALFALPLAQACATLRDAVAAGRSGTISAEPRPAATLRAFSTAGSRWVGRSVPHPMLPALLRGEPAFAADIRRPGMVYGRIVRAPASPDLPSRVQAFDESAARAVPGFIALVRDEALQHGRAEGIGVICATPGALDRAIEALAPKWQVEGSFGNAEIAAQIDIDAALAAGAGSLPHRVQGGDISAGSWHVDLRIDIAAAPHAGIEPRCAVAEFGDDGRLTVWTGSQDPYYVQAVLVRRLGLDGAKVQIQPMRLGGAFGGRTICTVELEAALLARAAARPVKLQWTRADEWQQGFHRPPSSHRVRLRLADGRVQTWWHAFVSTPILLTNAALPEWLNPITRLVGDGGAARGARLPYAVPRQRIEYALRRLPLYCGPWRGLGAGPNGLAVESAFDEAALRAGRDALEFRLAHAAEERFKGVLEAVGRAAGWGRPGPARHLGLAGGIYKETSFAAVVAEVTPRDGRWRVSGLWCAIDAGRLVHPDAVKAQCEGNLVWGLGMVFGGGLPLAAGGVAATGLAEARLPRMSDVPPIEIVLIDSAQPSGGAGETAIVGAAAAIANALRRASGQRATQFPLADDDPAASSRAT